MSLPDALHQLLPINPRINIEEVRELIRSNLDDFKNPAQLISRYRLEKSTNDDYKGRQIFELIQNVDDACSPYARIALDTTTKLLTIVNSGIPFSIQGFRSLMIPSLSPKRKKVYIGNKGLGFRSILNWSHQITVISNGIEMVFSNELAKEAFNTLFDESQQKSILHEFQYTSGTIPVPILAFPEVAQANSKGAETIIRINYLSHAEADILSQLESLREEILLFLQHICELNVSIDGDSKKIASEQLPDGSIRIGCKTWAVYSNDQQGEAPQLPLEYCDPEMQEKEVYSLKMALQRDLSDNVNQLFSFFPTKIRFCLPGIVHGTFELDSSRNRIIESAKNKFLVERLLDLIFQVSSRLKKESTTANWKAFQLLNHQNQLDPVLDGFGFYKAIDDRIINEINLPCLDGNYRGYGEVYALPDKFCSLICKLGLQAHFPDVLFPVPDETQSFFNRIFPQFQFQKKLPLIQFRSSLQKASLDLVGIVTAQIYADWVWEVGKQLSDQKKEPISILYNDEMDLVDKDYTVFTPTTGTSAVNIPEHIKIIFINSELYNSLLERYELTNDQDKSRSLKEKLEHFNNLQYFEPAPVLRQIINGTIDTLKLISDKDEKVSIVKSMLATLFKYYMTSKTAKDAQITVTNIPIITAAGTISAARDCLLSTCYPIGQLRNELLGNMYRKDQLIAPANELGIEGDIKDIQAFLLEFLDVNRFFILHKGEKSAAEDPYLAYAFKLQPRPDKFRSYQYECTSIYNLNAIEQQLHRNSISKEIIIACVCLDSKLRERVLGEADSKLRYSENIKTIDFYPNPLNNIPSYIRFQLATIIKVDDFVMENQEISMLNDFEFDYGAECFGRNNIDVITIKSILKQLGAKQFFHELDVSRIGALVHAWPLRDQQGRFARKFYQLCTEHYKLHRKIFEKGQGLLLYATKAGLKGYYPYKDVFYVNSVDLPRKMIAMHPLLNYPKRSGEHNVVEMFSVRTFNDVQYHAHQWTVDYTATRILGTYLKQIKPFILHLRLKAINVESDMQEVVRIVKSISITICTEFTYVYNDMEHDADLYDFVQEKDVRDRFLIKYTGGNSLEAMRKDSKFSDAIAEIFTIAFDVINIYNDIRLIFRNDLDDTKHQLIEEYGIESLDATLKRFRITNFDRKAWRALFQLKQIECALDQEDEDDFRKIIMDNLNLPVSLVAKVDFSLDASEQGMVIIYSLFATLEIDVEAFNALSDLDINFSRYHTLKFQKLITQITPCFTYQLWKHSLDKSISEQKEFRKRIGALSEISDSFIISHSRDSSVDHLGELYGLIETEFGFSMSAEDTYNKDYEAQLAENKIKMNWDGAIDRLNDEDFSLLYFLLPDDELARIKEALVIAYGLPAIGVGQNLGAVECNEVSEEITIKELFPTGITIGGSTNGSGVGGGKGISKNRRRGQEQSDDVKNALGERGERKVYNHLKTIYGENRVSWVSEYSDNPAKSDQEGYDIIFWKDPDSIPQYVEVKWFAGNRFFLTENELAFAKDHKDDYFIYLVTDEVINPVPINTLLDENLELIKHHDLFIVKVKKYEFIRK